MSSNFLELIEHAENSLKAVNDTAKRHSISMEKVSWKAVESIVKVQRAAQAEPAAYEAFLKERGVKLTKRTINPLHPTVAALTTQEARGTHRQRITLYAQVSYVLYDQGITDISGWLAAPENVGGTVLSGLTKGAAIYKSLPHVVAQRKARPSGPKRGSKAKGDLTVAVGYFTKSGRFIIIEQSKDASTIDEVSKMIGSPSPVISLRQAEGTFEDAVGTGLIAQAVSARSTIELCSP